MQITAIIHDPEHNLLRLLTAGDLEGWSPGVSAPVAQTIFDLFEPHSRRRLGVGARTTAATLP